MRESHEDLTWLGIALGDEGLVLLTERLISGLVSLYDFTNLLVHDEKMVVFVKYSRGEVLKFLSWKCSINHAGLMTV
jgi:hypothetical protein